MATKIILKNTDTLNSFPLVTDLEYGELAINYANGKLFFRNYNEDIVDITNQIYEDETKVYVSSNGTTPSKIGFNVENVEKLAVTTDGITFKSDLILNDAATLTLNDANNDKYIAVKAPDSLDYNYILKLPPVQPIDFTVLGNDGDGNLTWEKVDLFGGNRVYASYEYGDDDNDGTNTPVKTIKKAAQIAASLGQRPNTDPGEEFYNAKRLLERNRSYIQAEAIAFIDYNFINFNANFDQTKCERDTGIIIDAVTYDFSLGTNYNAITSGLAYQRGNAAVNKNYQKIQTLGSITHAKSQVGAQLTGAVLTLSDAAFDEILHIIDIGTPSQTLSFSPATTTTTNQNNSRLQLEINRTFLQTEVIAYLTAEFSSLNYDSDKCFRDVGYLVDALCYDIMYGGTSASVRAANSYFVDTNIDQLGTGESTATISAYEYLQTIVGYVIETNTNWTPYATTESQDNVTHPAGTSTESTLADSLLQIVIDTITAGDTLSTPSETFPSVTNEPYITDFNNIQNLKTTIVSSVINFITATYNGFTYNIDKCKRDVGLIIDSVVFDIILSGNEKSVAAGESYATVSVVINNQLLQTVETIKFVKRLSLSIIASETHSATYQTIELQTKYPRFPTTAAVSSIEDKFDIIIDILENNTVYTIIPADYVTIPVTIFVSSGDFYIDNPIIIPDKVSIVGDSLRSVVLRPLNANKDMFRVRNGAYMTGFTFRDGLNNDGKPENTFDWCIAFDDPTDTSVDRLGYFGLSDTKPTITLSPYIQNCSIISFLGGNGVKVDGSKVVTPNIPQFVIEAENPEVPADGVPEQGKSMVANAFTMVSFGGTGWLVTNDGYAQIVSCFQIFCLNGSYTQSGGYLSITNSATNFGLYALRSSGFSPNSFLFDRGIVATTGTYNGNVSILMIGAGRAAIEQYVIKILNSSGVDTTANHKTVGAIFDIDTSTDIDVVNNLITITLHNLLDGFSVLYDANGNTPIPGLIDSATYFIKDVSDNTVQLYNDEGLGSIVIITGTGSGTHKLIVNPEEFFVDTIIATHNDYQELTLVPGSYSFAVGDSITADTNGIPNFGYVISYDATTWKLLISVEEVLINDELQKTFFTSSSIIETISGITVSIDVTGASLRDTYYTSQFTVASSIASNVFINPFLANKQNIRLHRPSILNSSAHTWEYAGSGTDYNALPQNGGLGQGAVFEQFSDVPGRVYSSGTNELGDFKVGDFIIAENKSGNIIFKTQVEINELAIVKLALSDVAIEAFSTDIGLGDNEPGGASDARVSTQKAVRSFIANRLGNVLDKQASTNSIPGAVVLLNSAGQINADLIPASRGVTTYESTLYEGRLSLWSQIPVIEVFAGDNATETYEQITLTLTGNITITKNTTLTQQTSGATGVVKESITNSNTLILLYPTGTFNTTDVLVNGGTSLGANSVPSSVGAVVENIENYFLKSNNTNQFIILQNGVNYSFTAGSVITGANTAAQGIIESQPTVGYLYVLSTATLNGGSGYSPASGQQIYNNVNLTTTGAGTGAKANITVTNGSITNVDLTDGGTGYSAGDSIAVSAADVGGTGSNFSISVLTVQVRLNIQLTGSFVKFTASTTNPEYIEDNNATTFSITNTAVDIVTVNFNALDIGVGGSVDYANNTINAPSHGLLDGDGVVYDANGNASIGGLTSGTTYYVEVIDASNFKLHNNYNITLTSSISFSGGASGAHIFTLPAVNVDTDTYTVSGLTYSLTTGEALRVHSTATLPEPLSNNSYYYVGSITTRGFTLHISKGDALSSTNGTVTNAVDLLNTGSGSLNFTNQNVEVIGAYNNSSKDAANWGEITIATLDASNIVSGVLSSSRLATSGSASNTTFLRGDSSWAYAVQSIKRDPNSPVQLAGSFYVDGGYNYYYNNVEITISNTDGGQTNPNNSSYGSLGLSSFLKTQFTVTNGEVSIKAQVIDAGTVGGYSASDLLNPTNLSGSIGIDSGGTGLQTYSKGDMIYSGADDSLSQLNIGAANTVLVSDGQVPSWSDTIALGQNGSITINNNTVWHAGNDGSGSGLDADKLDGLDSGSFLRSDANDSMTGLLTLNRNADEQIRIGTQSTTGNPYISFYQSSTRRAYIQYVNGGALRLYNDRTDEYLDINSGIDGLTYVAEGTRYKIWHEGNDGASSSLDADTLDGYHYPVQGGNSTATNVSFNRIGFNGTSGNSGNTYSSYAYEIFQEGGAWTTPYPDLRINYHTGISFGANSGYNGYRFMGDYNNTTVKFQINGGSGYTYSNVWMKIGTEGFYSSTNSAYWEPNTTRPHTPWRMRGSRGSYGGFWDSYSNAHFMHDSSGNGGIYYNNGSSTRWHIYHSRGNNCLGIGSSTTSSSYILYASGSIYSTGDIVAYSDERLKENIVTVDDALNIVLKLRGVYYNRKDSDDKSKKIGVIAQEVEKVLPEVVTYSKDVDQYGVDYGKFAGLFIEAFKEQNKTIEILKNKINEQEKEIESIKKMLSEILNRK